MDINELPSELREQAKACKSEEELSALLAAKGIKLSDEELAGLAGGIDDHMCKLICGLDYSDPCSRVKF